VIKRFSSHCTQLKHRPRIFLDQWGAKNPILQANVPATWREPLALAKKTNWCGLICGNPGCKQVHLFVLSNDLRDRDFETVSHSICRVALRSRSCLPNAYSSRDFGAGWVCQCRAVLSPSRQISVHVNSVHIMKVGEKPLYFSSIAVSSRITPLASAPI